MYFGINCIIREWVFFVTGAGAKGSRAMPNNVKEHVVFDAKINIF